MSTEEPLFRPAKRRKTYRKRNGESDGDSIASSIPFIAPASRTRPPLSEEDLEDRFDSGPTADIEDGTCLAVAEILRQRKAARNRRGGIEFTNSTISLVNEAVTPHTSGVLVEKCESNRELHTVVNRFAPQTGQVADVDKHMMAYIESELAKRREGNSTASLDINSHIHEGLSLAIANKDGHLQRQPAALGKLHEIDLGPDATLTNIARTEVAKRRLEAGAVIEIEERVQKVKLRKDGKPWRGRKRRNSEDVKRDKLVEEVMRESRLELYDEPDEDTGTNDDQAADDRIAEQFRREFMDAISSRRHRTGPATTTKPVKGKPEVPKGPKLGGSRSARAAMREQQEKATKK